MESRDSVPPYIASVSYDRRLYRQDVAASNAHARMLATQGIISDEDASLICSGLQSILQEIEDGAFPWREELEDLHMNIEARLFEKIGEAAGRLHTARSRNDQVATDIRLYCKEVIQDTVAGLKALQEALVSVARAHSGVIMPGYTHLQRAQPVLFAHHLLTYFHMLQRDRERFAECLRRTDVLPLGSGALAGVPYPVDREMVAKELGFSRVSENSIDAVSDRDFLVEYHANAALCMAHLSRLAEELVVWSSQEFGFVRLGDDYTSGSSIMPQKRNPDVAELARGKTGRVYGYLVGALTMLKGLPLAYNRDLQEDKQGFFDTVDTLLSTLPVFTGMVATMEVRSERMREAAGDASMLATDLADYLVRKGEPFRAAHGIVADLVRHAESQGVSLSELQLSDYHRFSPRFDEDVYEVSAESSVAGRDVPGGTAPRRVAEALREADHLLEAEL
ncbi:MAG: argininosuccinate lyase [Chloroflexota bacterium]|nr:argininosuccinate lyase [Chloroflexota bacterium]MDE2941739.1 argininosuccinate lyase [Chloroflexota bacterium]MDE3268464.1 argininosuccinate lyase [Chloroflexota bacterium]